MSRELRPGDIIEVLQYEQTGIMVHEVWKLAKILAIGDAKMLVQFLKEKEKRLYISQHEYGKAWR